MCRPRWMGSCAALTSAPTAVLTTRWGHGMAVHKEEHLFPLLLYI